MKKPEKKKRKQPDPYGRYSNRNKEIEITGKGSFPCAFCGQLVPLGYPRKKTKFAQCPHCQSVYHFDWKSGLSKRISPGARRVHLKRNEDSHVKARSKKTN